MNFSYTPTISDYYYCNDWLLMLDMVSQTTSPIKQQQGTTKKVGLKI